MARPDRDPDQVWSLTLHGREHRVESRGTTVHRVRWLVDGSEVATASRMDERFTVTAPDDAGGPSRLQLVFSTLGHGRRATLVVPDEPDVDLEPAPGSPAARHEARVREHPRRHAAIAAGGAVAKVLGGLLVVWLLAQVVVRVPWPDWGLPSIPWPSLPSIPWPDLPSIPWPDVDLPSFSTPDWLQYVAPVLVAVVIALHEVRRRRQQDERRRAAREERDGGSIEP
ncbi:hypothetical protein [Nocardioides nanhaiensis]|uniref:Uncharacterized protein n=1 Tax=Nocardioides nanhaiensis TaxID=1476871 RepID=A0ABP8VR50_9ACTN